MARRVVKTTEEIIQRKITEEIFEDDMPNATVTQEETLPSSGRGIVPAATTDVIAMSPSSVMLTLLGRRTY